MRVPKTRKRQTGKMAIVGHGKVSLGFLIIVLEHLFENANR